MCLVTKLIYVCFFSAQFLFRLLKVGSNFSFRCFSFIFFQTKAGALCCVRGGGGFGVGVPPTSVLVELVILANFST